MKIPFKLKPALVLGFVLSAYTTLSHDAPVHIAITMNAIESAFDDSLGFRNFMDSISSDFPYAGQNGATNAIVYGSWREDDFNEDAGGIRSYNHFYDPLDTTYGKGLSDYPPDIRTIIGNNSFVWASTYNCPGLNFYLPLPNVSTLNTRSWQNARSNEWVGLTAPSQAARQSALDDTFRDVGQVVHLLEDTSQPQHVRNEQHTVYTIWQSPIEAYGKEHAAQLNYQHGMFDWRGAGFTKLEDFWDRHFYNGNAAALNAAENGGASTLGLAEWCNGNFLGARHLYPEYYQSNDISYYPYPSRNHSTDYSQKVVNLPSGMQPLILRNGYKGTNIYLNKTGDGVTYPDISRFTYFGAKFPSFGMMTINDANVLSNYHNEFIPKAVEYGAGLLDYFFRGTLGVAVTNNNDGTYSLTITNISSQDFSGGSFHLFYDDADGVRTELTGDDFDISGYSGALAPGEATESFFTPNANAVNYTLVYQGTVGTTSGSASDPADAGIAIAANSFPACHVPNDNFTNAIEIPSLPYAYSENTACTTFEDGEPQPFCSWIGSTAWFRFTATDSDDISIDTFGSDFDTVLAVYSGDSLDNLAEVACNDDYSGHGLQSAVQFTPAPGTTYYVQAGGYDGAAGNLVVEMAVAPPFCDGQTTNISDLTWDVNIYYDPGHPAPHGNPSGSGSGGSANVFTDDGSIVSAGSQSLCVARGYTVHIEYDFTLPDEYSVGSSNVDNRNYHSFEGGGHVTGSYDVDLAKGAHFFGIDVFSSNPYNTKAISGSIHISPLTPP